MHFLDLDFDLVHTILSYVDHEDMLQLATTCTSLYEPMVQHRLAQVNTENFIQRENFRKYCDYMLCDARRPRYLTGIAVARFPQASTEDNSYHDEELFAQIIRQTTRLNLVQCAIYPDDFQSAPVLLDAIASVTTLTSLDLTLYDDDMLRILSSLQSNPYQLVCRFQSPAERVEPPCAPIPRFLGLLAAFSHLHTLDLINASPVLFERGDSDEAMTLPSVRVLTVRHRTYPNLHLAACIFPNVESLDLPLGTNELQIPFAWPSIRYLSTRYPVAITTHVHHISIPIFLGRGTHPSTAMLHRLSPSVIDINIDRAGLQAVAHLPQPIRFLQLCTAASLNVGLQQYLHDYLAILKEVPLVGLTLKLPTSMKGNADHAHSLRAMCTWMASCVPSLKYVGLAWFTYSRNAKHTIDSSSWFEVTTRPDCNSPWLMPLSTSEGDALYARLLGTARP
ncbi:hypothetical protein C8Q72DRAFT_914439 [Fomitopsis betulina]|nr:hypothetical protein C8Q72DRAFT_914439 [Fomitopsis betulina]